MNVLVWLRRDLRLDHQPALAAAAAAGRVLPVYVVDPQMWRSPDASARQWEFLRESLEEAREDFRAAGLTLAIRVGSPLDVLSRLCQQLDICEIHLSSGLYSAPEVEAATSVERWARASGVAWRMSGPTAAAPLPPISGMTDVSAGLVPTAKALRLAEDRCPYRQKGGRTLALAGLDTFLTTRAFGYRQSTQAPLGGERATSRLSPYLTHGLLAKEEVLAAASSRLQDRAGPQWQSGLLSFCQTLVQDGGPLAPKSDRDDTALPSPTILEAWEAGQTGLPFLDAALRYLDATGWLGAKMRAMALMSAVHLLGLPPQAAGAALARKVTDYHPVMHWNNVHIALSAATAARLPDPVAMGEKLDPEGRFVRRWVPELAEVPLPYLHRPWRWSGASRFLGRKYPEALVDVSTARRAALAQLPRAPAPRAARAMLHSVPGLDPVVIEGKGMSSQNPTDRQYRLDL